jgi:hypothetical protein
MLHEHISLSKGSKFFLEQGNQWMKKCFGIIIRLYLNTCFSLGLETEYLNLLFLSI